MKRRAKQMEILIDDINMYLRRNYIKAESNPAFLIVQHSLLEQGLYRGFNYFKDKKLEDGTIISVLAGSSDPSEFDYIQLY